MSKNLPVDWSKNLTIYEVNLRQYTKSGSFKDFEIHLPRLQQLGIGIIWFMPVQPIGIKERKGNLGSYYSISDYKAVDPVYGSMEEFIALVEKIHSMGMYVILDWVANHTAWDNILTVDHPEYYVLDENGNFKPPFKEWADVIKLDYNKRELREYMVNCMKFWVETTGIDGFRCDMANLVPTDFWQYAHKELFKVKPLFMLAEAEQQELLYGAFDAIYNWNLFHTFDHIAKGEKSVWDLTSMIDKEIFQFPEHAYQMMFISNHDENSWNGSELERLGHGLEAFAVLYFTLTGIPLIYSGQEAGNPKRISFFEKDEIEWKEDKMFPLYSKLISFKKETEALWSGPYGGELILLDTQNGYNTISYIRQKGESRVFAVINLSGYHQFAHIHDNRIEGYYNDLFNDDKYTIFDDYYFTLGPWEYKILKGI
ncbi:MAG TPA: alpha-amylase family glycosyl hydrolase [Lentimicrobium sp.]|nr:alpha-amylase family glycosyl hydrolase [Lentimicrobium sp.]